MASVDDVFHQLQTANTTLGQIHADEIAETNATNAVKASVDTVDGDIRAGFGATVNALNAIAQIEIDAVKLLFHLTEQADAMICALEHISQNTCQILTQATLQTQLQTDLEHDVDVVRELAESANPAAALERARLAALRAEVEKCCPPQQARPACTYEPCPHPERVGMPDLPRVPTPQQPG